MFPKHLHKTGWRIPAGSHKQELGREGERFLLASACHSILRTDPEGGRHGMTGRVVRKSIRGGIADFTRFQVQIRGCGTCGGIIGEIVLRSGFGDAGILIGHSDLV